MRSRAPSTTVAAALCFLSLSGGVGARAEKQSADRSIRWASSFETALEEASIEGRPVMVLFFATWCGWCRRLDRDTLADREVIERSARVVNVKVNGETRADLLRRFSVRSYPTTLFLRSDGTIVSRIRGYSKPEAFASLLDELLDTRAEEFILRQRLKDHPDLFAVRHDLALLLLNRGSPDQALEQLDRLVAAGERVAEKRRWEVRLDRGRALYRAGRAAEARQELEGYIQHRGDSPRLPEAIFLLGEAALVQGKQKEARRWFRRLLEIDPEGWLAERSRSRLADLG